MRKSLKSDGKTFIELHAIMFVASSHTSTLIIPNVLLGILLQNTSLVSIHILYSVQDENNVIIIRNCLHSIMTNETIQN